MPTPWKSDLPSPVDCRRRLIIDILAGHLAKMPRSGAIPSKSPLDPEHEADRQISHQISQNGLELSAK
jgi:hypothetical protein